MCGDRLKAERVLIWLVHNSFEIHSFINHFFGFSIIVPKNPMIQVASCEQALIKINGKPIQNHQSKTMFLFKHTHLNLSLTDIWSTMVTYQGMQNGFFMFVVGEFNAFEIFMQNDCFAKPDFLYFSNWKHKK